MLNAHGLLWVVCLLNFLIVWLDLLVVTTWTWRLVTWSLAAQVLLSISPRASSERQGRDRASQRT